MMGRKPRAAAVLAGAGLSLACLASAPAQAAGEVISISPGSSGETQLEFGICLNERTALPGRIDVDYTVSDGGSVISSVSVPDSGTVYLDTPDCPTPFVVLNAEGLDPGRGYTIGVRVTIHPMPYSEDVDDFVSAGCETIVLSSSLAVSTAAHDTSGDGAPGDEPIDEGTPGEDPPAEDPPGADPGATAETTDMADEGSDIGAPAFAPILRMTAPLAACDGSSGPAEYPGGGDSGSESPGPSDIPTNPGTGTTETGSTSPNGGNVTPVVILNPSAFTPSRLAALSPSQVGTIAPSTFGQLSPATFGALTAKQAAALSSAQVSSIRPARAAELKPSTVAALPVSTIASLRPAAVKFLSPEAIGALTMSQLKALTPRQVAALRPLQLAQLSAAERVLLRS